MREGAQAKVTVHQLSHELMSPERPPPFNVLIGDQDGALPLKAASPTGEAVEGLGLNDGQ